MAALLESGVREALDETAGRADGKRDELAALAVEGIRDGFWIQDARQQARWDYLCHCLATDGGRVMLLGEWPEEQGFVMDPLNDDERDLCRDSGLWGEPGLCENAPRFVDVLMPFDLRWQPPESDDGDPFLLSNEPTTKALAALRLAIVHDAYFIDDPILAMAVEQTADDWPVQCQLMVWQGMYCREDAELWRLFPADANPKRIKARLAKWEVDAFREQQVEPEAGNVSQVDNDDDDHQFDKTDVEIMRAALDHGATDLHCCTTYDKIAEEIDSTWTRDSISKRMGRLKSLGLFEGKRGNGGGVWLTEKGVEVAKSFEKD